MMARSTPIFDSVVAASSVNELLAARSIVAKRLLTEHKRTRPQTMMILALIDSDIKDIHERAEHMEWRHSYWKFPIEDDAGQGQSVMATNEGVCHVCGRDLLPTTEPWPEPMNEDYDDIELTCGFHTYWLGVENYNWSVSTWRKGFEL